MAFPLIGNPPHRTLFHIVSISSILTGHFCAATRPQCVYLGTCIHDNIRSLRSLSCSCFSFLFLSSFSSISLFARSLTTERTTKHSIKKKKKRKRKTSALCSTPCASNISSPNSQSAPSSANVFTFRSCLDWLTTPLFRQTLKVLLLLRTFSLSVRFGLANYFYVLLS